MKDSTKEKNIGENIVCPPDFQSCSSEEIESTVSKMSPDEISSAIVQINEDHDPKWKEKTRAALLGINKRTQLEAAGRSLSVAQAIELIDHTLQIEDKHHWKLPPLLVGMPLDIFSQILDLATEQHLHLFQHEGVTEPIQHQLTTLGHKMMTQIEDMEKEIDFFDDEIENLIIEELCRDDALEKLHKIGLYGKFFQKLFDRSNKALAIAWNTKRLDLIETLNKVKDSCQKYTLYGIGTPRRDSTPPSGLYAKLEDKLFQIFGNATSAEDPETLRDDEPALEALVKFSVWYMRDYWEMGLLPTIHKREDLDLDIEKHTENERVQYREKLFTEVQRNLEKIGLSTVNDLKRALIFSKKTFLEYVEQTLIDA